MLIAKLYAFRSVLNKEFNSKSDIDLIVKLHSKVLKPEEIGELYWLVNEQLEYIFNRKVDLLLDSKFRNPVFQKEIDETKVLIYENKNQEVFA